MKLIRVMDIHTLLALIPIHDDALEGSIELLEKSGFDVDVVETTTVADFLAEWMEDEEGA